jgi:dolichol-phosphate mannosyltransferase
MVVVAVAAMEPIIVSLLLSVVIPTYNERENIVAQLQVVIKQLEGLIGRYEIIVVDDGSPDGTAECVLPFINETIHLVQRAARRDLSTALMEGFNRAQGKYVLAMDADLQHDASAILKMLTKAESTDADVVVATRYAAEGSVQGWSWSRRQLSGCGVRLVERYLSQSVSDPLSGFFLLRHSAWQQLQKQLQPAGFKLLLDILVANPSLVCEEVGYCFMPRQRGHSKLGIQQCAIFLRVLWKMARKPL